MTTASFSAVKKTASIGYSITIEPLPASDRQSRTRVGKKRAFRYNGAHSRSVCREKPWSHWLANAGCVYRLRMKRCAQMIRLARLLELRLLELAVLEMSPCRGRFFTQGVVTMRDLNSRSLNTGRGFDRVLMAVAATFLTVSATSAMAQDQGRRRSAAETRHRRGNPKARARQTSRLRPPAISRSTPRPPPPPPSAKTRHPDRQQARRRQARRRRGPHRPPTPRSPPTAPATAAAPPAGARARPRPRATLLRRISRSPKKLKDALAAKDAPLFSTAGANAPRSRKFYGSRDYAPLWTQSGGLTENARGAIARLKDAASDGLNAADYPVPDFTSATLARCAGRSRPEADLQRARLCAPGAEAGGCTGRRSPATSNIRSTRPIRPKVLTNVTARQGTLRSPSTATIRRKKLYKALESQARRIARRRRTWR